MIYQLPTKGFVRLNVVLSFLFSAMVTLILVGLDYDRTDTAYRLFQALIFTNMVSFGNMGLLMWNSQNPKKDNKMSWSFYGLSYFWSLVSWVLVVNLYSLVTGKVWEGKNEPANAYFLAIVVIFFFNTIILIVQNLFISRYRNAQHEIEKYQLQANISDATNLLLRQQIQPHFLFNALTTVKSLYKEDVRLGETYLVHLANFLRVSVSNPKEHTALVKDEIAFCLNYLKMQKIRFGSAIEYDIQISEEVLEKEYIPYFSLQPLIENALKHNEVTEQNPIRIEIYEKGGYILVRNNLRENINKEKSAGNGLFNLRERYRLLGEEEIKITSDDVFFTVYLKFLKK